MNPRATAIIPCHPRNRPTLPRTLESVEAAAKGCDVEVVVVDDDESRGLSWARNDGLRRARGDVVFFVDADDTVRPAYFSRLLETVEATGADFALSSFDYAPLKREYYTSAEIWLLKRMEPVYRYYPWKSLLKTGTKGVATTEYGRKLMHDIMMTYDGDQERYAKLSGHGFRMLAEAFEADLKYKIPCPALLICGTKDRAGSCKRYSRAWHKKSGIPLKWIEGAGHNSNTDAPEIVNGLIEGLAAISE
jgi:glycosyltransferase involved in cell wall biosynthesis